MKTALLRNAKVVLSYVGSALSKTGAAAKHPVGIAIVSVTATSLATYALGKTHREKELKQTKEKLDAAESMIEELKIHNEKHNISLREADKYGNRTRSDLIECRSQLRLIQYAFLNSCCIWKQKVPSIAENKPQKQTDVPFKTP